MGEQNRVEEIRERLAAAGLNGDLRVRVGYEGARHIPLIDHGSGLESEVVARVYEADDDSHAHVWPRAQLIASAPADLAALLDEVERARDLVEVVAAENSRLRLRIVFLSQYACRCELDDLSKAVNTSICPVHCGPAAEEAPSCP